MAAEEEDYLLNMLQQLREFVAQVMRLRDSGSIEEALLAVVRARERLFARPSAEFASLPVVEQLSLLAQGERPEVARGKCVAYAAILREAGLVYEAKGEKAMGAGAFQLALYIYLIVATQAPEDHAALRTAIDELLGRVDADALYPPVKALLTQVPP